jgi:histidine ammonia-lyase
VLGPKEGLALLNGTQVSTSLALAGLFQAESVLAAGLVAGCLTLEAIQGSIKPFDARIHEARGQQGQIAVAPPCVPCWTAAPSILAPNCGRAGSLFHPLRAAGHGRLPGQPQPCCARAGHRSQCRLGQSAGVRQRRRDFGRQLPRRTRGFAADIMALAIAEIGAISERRMALLLDTGLSRLPAFLIEDSGVNSGFMIAQVTAAALAAENQCLAHPSSVTSLPTSANQEDHVSMATYGARRLADMARNTAVIVGVEAMAAVQGMDFDRRLKSSPLIEEQYALIRSQVPYLDKDRYLAPDIEIMRLWALETAWPEVLQSILPSSAA